MTIETIKEELNGKTPMGAAGVLMKHMDILSGKELTEENKFLMMDINDQAMQVMDKLRCDITIGMMRERIGKMQRAMGY